MKYKFCSCFKYIAVHFFCKEFKGSLQNAKILSFIKSNLVSFVWESRLKIFDRWQKTVKLYVSVTKIKTIHIVFYDVCRAITCE